MPAPPSQLLTIALDLSVIDHLQKIESGRYSGSSEIAFRKLRAAGESGVIAVWVCEISLVEMLHGIEKLATDPTKQKRAKDNDTTKLSILKKMSAQQLGYPCSSFDDDYSRWDITFRFAGPDSDKAKEVESRLLEVSGISPGDARQLVSCAFAFDGDNIDAHPSLNWFVTEDRKLIRGITTAIRSGCFSELATLKFGTADDVTMTHADIFGEI